MDSLTDIAVFVQVVDNGSFTAAADRIGVSRPVVSKYVSRLEERLGLRLLNRTTRRLSLTEAGRVFYERCQKGLAEIEDAELEVSQLQVEPRGILRLSVPMSFGILHVAPSLPEFQRRFPQVDVDVLLDDRKIDVVSEGIDVALRISALPDSSIVAKRLATCRHAVVAAPAYLERQGIPQHPGDLPGHRIVTYRYQESALDWQFQGPDRSAVSVQLRSSCKLNNSLAIRSAVLESAGIARMPTFVVGSDIRDGKLVRLLDNYRSPEVAISLLYSERRHLSPKIRAFVDFMCDKICDPPYWDR